MVEAEPAPARMVEIRSIRNNLAYCFSSVVSLQTALVQILLHLVMTYTQEQFHTLKDAFLKLTQPYGADETVSLNMWNEIFIHYTQKHRTYHTLYHLENMLTELKPIKDELEDWDATLFALFYHDIIYNVTKKNNEEKSAALADKRLSAIHFPTDRKLRCINSIMATKAHGHSNDSDTNFFTDTDLCILGASPEKYKTYCKQVRKEYSLYPDFLYNPGRKKVLQHFLSMERIFKTNHFYNHYEQNARVNILHEIEML